MDEQIGGNMERFFKLTLALTMLVTVLVFASSCGLDKAIYSWLYPKYETTEVYHIMRKGDTVWDISENYFLRQDRIKNLNEFIYMVRRYNGLINTKRMVQPGDVLVIPLGRKVCQ